MDEFGVVPDHMIAAGRHDDSRIDIRAERIEILHAVVSKDLFQRGSVEIEPGSLNIGQTPNFFIRAMASGL